MRRFLEQKPDSYECGPVAIFNAIRYQYPHFPLKKYSNIRRRCKCVPFTSGTKFSNLDLAINNYSQYFENILYTAPNRNQDTLWQLVKHHVAFEKRAAIANLENKQIGQNKDMTHTVLIRNFDQDHYEIEGLNNQLFQSDPLESKYWIWAMWVLFYEEEKERTGHYLDYDDIELGRYKL
jgi:hypothetical protein